MIESAMTDLARWDARYSAPGYLFGTEPNSFLKEQAPRLKAGEIALAIADGEGRNGVWLAEQGLKVVSIDFPPIALEKARRLAAARGVTIQTVQVDLAHWAWPSAAFDVIVAIFIQFAGPALRKQIFDGIRQALRPGGLLLMQGYRPEQLAYGTGGPSEPDNLYTRALLEESFADFSSLEIREHDSMIREGSAHAGMSALIDLIARK